MSFADNSRMFVREKTARGHTYLYLVESVREGGRVAYFTARRYDDAIGILRTIKDPVNEVRGWLAASYAGAGRYDEARATLTVFLRIAEDDMVEFPEHVPDAWKDYWRGIAVQYQDEADFEHLYDALTKSGLED